MIDFEIKKTLTELYGYLNPRIVQRVMSHLASLQAQIESLTKSRDNWKEKYKKIKEKV